MGVITYTYRAPALLEDTWRAGGKNAPGEMRDAFRADIDAVRSMLADGEELIPVQGRISDMKSWFAACLAQELADDGVGVAMLSPQRQNRGSAVDKLDLFGGQFFEHPGRLDLCTWEPWRDNVGHVDRATCQAINCPNYVDAQEDRAFRTAEEVGKHQAVRGGRTEMDTEEMVDMGGRQSMCPAQLCNTARSMEETAPAVDAATYAKAFTELAAEDGGPLDADVLVLDEAHDVAADPDHVQDAVEPAGVAESLRAVISFLASRGERWAASLRRELADLADCLGHWFETSKSAHVHPDGIFGSTMSLSGAFSALDRVDGRLMQLTNRRVSRNEWGGGVQEAADPYRASQRVRSFLSKVNEFREGRADFVHIRYEEGGTPVNEMAFRRVDTAAETGGGVAPEAVYEEWLDAGTHPAIAERWGPLLDRHIEALWAGRQIVTAEGRPGAPITPMDELKRVAGAGSVVALSATHNELSDPTREPGDLRATRHRLVCAPVYLRSDPDEREDYHGRRTASPDTPWFRSLFDAAMDDCDDTVAAVPINSRNARKWGGYPLATDADGEPIVVVPHSRGSIGEKDFEQYDVDTVACGVQVQSPAPTARRLVLLWEILAPRAGSPGEVLDASWRLLAQHAVSGTIQAGGRFEWDAVNVVFERPDLFELAGFEVEEAGPGDPGFAGAFARAVEREHARWSADRDAVRALKTVDYLEEQARKSPTVRQALSEYARVYDATEAEARRAVYLACDRGKIEPYDTQYGVKFKPT